MAGNHKIMAFGLNLCRYKYLLQIKSFKRQLTSQAQ